MQHAKRAEGDWGENRARRGLAERGWEQKWGREFGDGKEKWVIEL